MIRQSVRKSSLGQDPRPIIGAESGSVMVEFAIIANMFLMMLMGIFELSFDMFTQAVLDGALQTATRELQTGNAQNVQNGTTFLNNYLCPAVSGLLNCNGLYISVQRLSPTSSQDLYDFTTGTPPLTGGALDLSSYSSGSFCNSGPAELLLISAVYVGPSLIGGLLPGFSVQYNGRRVHATLATASVVTENYTMQNAGNGVVVAPSC